MVIEMEYDITSAIVFVTCMHAMFSRGDYQ